MQPHQRLKQRSRSTETAPDTYADCCTRFLPSVLLTVNGLPRDNIDLFNKSLNDAMRPFERAGVFLNYLATRDVELSVKNIKEGARFIIDNEARQTLETYRNKFMIHIDLDKHPLVEPIDTKKPFTKAMRILVDKLECDYRRFAKAKDTDAIMRMIYTYCAPIGQYIGLTALNEDIADNVIVKVISSMVEETRRALTLHAA